MGSGWKERLAYGVVALIIAATLFEVFQDVGSGRSPMPNGDSAPVCTRRPCE